MAEPTKGSDAAIVRKPSMTALEAKLLKLNPYLIAGKKASAELADQCYVCLDSGGVVGKLRVISVLFKSEAVIATNNKGETKAWPQVKWIAICGHCINTLRTM